LIFDNSEAATKQILLAQTKLDKLEQFDSKGYRRLTKLIETLEPFSKMWKAVEDAYYIKLDEYKAVREKLEE